MPIKMSGLEPLLEQLPLRLGAAVERLKRRPVSADEMLDAALSSNDSSKRGEVYLAAKVEPANALLAGERGLINGRVTNAHCAGVSSRFSARCRPAG